MISLAHFTQMESPIGLSIFLLGFAAGLAAALCPQLGCIDANLPHGLSAPP